MKVCFFGTYDGDQPRTRVLIEGLRHAGVIVIEHRLALWTDSAQKIGVARRPSVLLGHLGRFVRVYARLLRDARSVETCDGVIYPHFGQLDLIATGWVFQRRGIPVIWDALISAFDTAAGDRQLVDVRSLRARSFALLDRLAGRRTDCLLADTEQNAAFWRQRFGVAADRLRVVPVGAEDHYAGQRSGDRVFERRSDARFEVLFIGKYIPLHGIETVLRAAAILAGQPDTRFTLVGTGQERPMADELAAALNLRNVQFVDWVAYADLPELIAAADVCLGIFGTGDKARRVVPNKAYQALAAGCPLITADTPAARAGLCRNGLVGALLVPPGDPDALAAAILALSRDPARCMALSRAGRVLHERFYRSALIGQQLAAIVREITERPSLAPPRAAGS